MGYRSSMPIIELKLTGPASEKAAMLALWPEVQRVAGESLIFEGTEGLPAQIAAHLQSRQLSVTLSEQFTGGLLALQLTRAGAPLLASEVVPFQQETLAQTARWASERRVKHFAGLALFVGGLDEEHLNFATATPEGTHALRVRMSITRHSGRASGGVRDDGAEHAAPLAERERGRQRARLDQRRRIAVRGVRVCRGRVPGNGYASAFASKVMGCSQRLLVDISICHLQVSQSVTTISAPLSSIWRNSGAPMACDVG